MFYQVSPFTEVRSEVEVLLKRIAKECHLIQKKLESRFQYEFCRRVDRRGDYVRGWQGTLGELSAMLSFVSITLLALLCCFAPVASAQVDLGSLTGTVTDASGGVLPGVTITAVNLGTKVVYPGVTGASGDYQIANLPIGTYTVRYESKGYRALNRENVVIKISQVLELNQVLTVGATADTVNVTAATPLLETQRATINLNLDAEAITDLPLDVSGGRDITVFAYKLAPTTTGGNYSGHIAGSQDSTKNVIVDGTDASAGLQGFVQVVGTEAVKQFEIQVSGITAEAARTGGGNLLLELKSGTNKLHGSAYSFLANEILDANTWDNNQRIAVDCTPGDSTCARQYQRPRTRFLDYGFSAGGPLWRDHTFIFGDYEHYNQAQQTYQQNGATVPTPAFLAGDFSALTAGNTVINDPTTQLPIINPCTGQPYIKGQIFDPQTAQVINGSTCYSPFSGNVIPNGRISSVASKVLPLYQQYQPTAATLTNNYAAYTGTPSLINEHVDLKLDHQLTPSERLTSSYNWWSLPRVTGGNLWQTGTLTGGSLSPADTQRQENRAIRLQLTSTLSPTLLNFVSFAYNENAASDQANVAVNPAPLGFTQTSNAQNLPTINFGGTVNGNYESSIGNRFADGYVYSASIFNDAVTMSRGAHTLKFGGDFIAKLINSRTDGGLQTYNFSNLTDSPVDPLVQPYVGFAFANFLLGQVQSASNNADFLLHGRRKLFSLFAQDDWKARHDVTLNFGLRYDFDFPFHETNGRWTNFDVNANNPAWGNYNGAYTFASDGSSSFETKQNYLQFGPHVGGSYQPFNKLVFRAAYGVFYVPLGVNQFQGVPLASAGGAVGYIGTNNVLNPSQNLPAFNLNGGYPGSISFPPRTTTLTDVSGGAVYVAPNELTLGITQNWNIGFQYSFAPSVVFSLNYLANAGHKLHDASLVPYNYPTLSTYLPLLSSGHINDVITNAGQATAAGVPYPYAGFSGYAYQAINPYPQLASAGQQLLYVGPPDGTSAYRSLIAEIETRSWHNLTADFNYTFSRAEGNVSDGGAYQDGPGTAYTQNPYDAASRKSNVLDYNMTHQGKGYINYNLPFGTNQRLLSSGRTLDAIVGGFTVGAQFGYNSGTPFTAVVSQNNYPGWIRVFANINENVSTKNSFKTLDLNNLGSTNSTFFNSALFSNPAYGSFGNQPAIYTKLTNWGYADEDLSVIKAVSFGPDQRVRASLRVQFFDVLNRHHWNNPDTDISNTALFGHVTGVSGFRYGQLGARVEF